MFGGNAGEKPYSEYQFRCLIFLRHKIEQSIDFYFENTDKLKYLLKIRAFKPDRITE